MSVSVSLINSLVEGVRRTGVDVQTFLSHVNLDLAFLAQPHNRVSLADYDRLILLALQETKSPALGLQLGELDSITAFNVVEYLAANAENIRHGISVFINYYQLLYDAPSPKLVEEGEFATIELSLPKSSLLCERVRSEYFVIRILALGDLLLGTGEAATKEICFMHSQPDYIEEYNRLISCAVKFDQPQTSITFRRELLDTQKRVLNNNLVAFLKDQADDCMKYQSNENNWCNKVELYIKEHHQTEKTDIKMVAQAFNVSARTLQRRLQQEGKTYAEVVSETLALIAQSLLSKSENSIKEVSYIMGFSSTTAFHRAFKRWTGETPKAYVAAATKFVSIDLRSDDEQ